MRPGARDRTDGLCWGQAVQGDDPDAAGPKSGPSLDAPQAAFDASGSRVLAVDLAAGQIDPLMRPPPVACVFARFQQVTAAFLAKVAPDIVVAPLFGPDFDVLDLADRLTATGFGGRLLALTAPLPRPEAVRAEVRTHAAGIVFDLVLLPGRPDG